MESELKLTGPQKAAVILMALGEDIAARVLTHLSPEETRKIIGEIAKLDYISSDMVDFAVNEFSELMAEGSAIGGKERATRLAERVLGKGAKIDEDKPEKSPDEERKAIDILKEADPHAILENIRNDQPQTIAIVLRELSPVKSSRILTALSPDMRKEVIRKMTTLGESSSGVIDGIAKTLEPKLKSAISKDVMRRSSGLGVASTIISYIGGAEAKEILKEIEKANPETAERMRELIFTFDDLLNLDDRAVQRVVREVDRRDLVVSFKAAPEKIKDKILRNLSERAKEELMEEFETLGPVRVTEVEEAQRKIVEIVRRLDESGEISIIREEEKYI